MIVDFDRCKKSDHLEDKDQDAIAEGEITRQDETIWNETMIGMVENNIGAGCWHHLEFRKLDGLQDLMSEQVSKRVGWGGRCVELWETGSNLNQEHLATPKLVWRLVDIFKVVFVIKISEFVFPANNYLPDDKQLVSIQSGVFRSMRYLVLPAYPLACKEKNANGLRNGFKQQHVGLPPFRSKPYYPHFDNEMNIYKVRPRIRVLK